MKIFTLFLASFFVVLTVYTPIFSATGAPDGFKNIKFGDKPPKNFKQVDKVFDETSTKSRNNPEIIYINQDGADKDFFGNSVSNVRYWFCKNKLFRITMNFADPSFSNITKKLSEQNFKKGAIDNNKNSEHDISSERWDRGKIFIWINRDNIKNNIKGDFYTHEVYEAACEPD